jgi:NADPH:quinone reductase-like Zn-dependent oxidoreductase
MQAMAIESYGEPGQLREMELPDPKAPPDALLIRVRAAGVNPVDASIRAGYLDGAFPSFFPLVPGWDVAGVVESAGPAVDGFTAGDEVIAYARQDFIQEGTYAELASVRATQAAPKPRSLSFEQAAALPLAGLTAYQAVHDKLQLESGQTVIVQGASGGVGSFAVQLARAIGCHVIGIASEKNHGYLRELGASECLDYSDDVAEALLAEHPDGADALIDLVGGDALEQAPELLREGARAVSVIQPPDTAAFDGRGVRALYEFVRPDADQLQVLGGMADAGELRVELSETLALSEAARAHELIESGHTRGKLALTIDT